MQADLVGPSRESFPSRFLSFPLLYRLLLLLTTTVVSISLDAQESAGEWRSRSLPNLAVHAFALRPGFPSVHKHSVSRAGYVCCSPRVSCRSRLMKGKMGVLSGSEGSLEESEGEKSGCEERSRWSSIAISVIESQAKVTVIWEEGEREGHSVCEGDEETRIAGSPVYKFTRTRSRRSLSASNTGLGSAAKLIT